MKQAQPLPRYLADRYRIWQEETHAPNQALYQKLIDEGQSPKALVIACCDSRVQIESLFNSEAGELFVHRNIANLVPSYADDGGVHGTSSVIEYAVTALKVEHILVIGHSKCGGVKGCHDMCAGHAPELEEKTSFVGRWVDAIRPAYDRITDLPQEQRLEALEKEAVVLSLENLMGFPFVRDAVNAGDLSLHGLWKDIAAGELYQYDADRGAYAPV